MAEVTGLGVRRITREPTPILFELVGDNGPEIQSGFDRLEARVRLRGRRFSGSIDPGLGGYLVAVALVPVLVNESTGADDSAYGPSVSLASNKSCS